MLDHVLGRPSVTVRKWQVLFAITAWMLYLLRGNRHGPPGLRRLSSILTKRLSAWQTIIVVSLGHYMLRNLGKLVGLECPEPLANLYESAYFRATWATTALDAGFWTAMPIRRRWLSHICSIIFTGYYLINAEQADEKVRAVRSIVTVEHLRNSWDKTLFNPYLKFTTWLLRPRTMRYAPREIRIKRPQGSKYSEPVHGWLYFDGPISTLKHQTKLILNIPGGGFVAMSPRTHDDSLMSWAAKTDIPILSLDYRKAPEFPYPYALHECFDVYKQIVLSRGRCVGLYTEQMPQIIVSGDSAGGSLATGLTLMILETSAGISKRHPLSTPVAHTRHHTELPAPCGLILIYPCLDVNIGNWMTDEQMSLIRDKSSRNTNHRVLRRKDSVFMRAANTPYASENDSPDPSSSSDDDDDESADEALPHPAFNLIRSPDPSSNNPTHPDSSPPRFKTLIAVPSMISYFSDRILTPEMMRAMIILYIGQRAKPDFSSDYYLSPVLAPDELLQRFPRTYFLTGERDPLVDDTCIMAGRLRRAQGGAEGVRVSLIPGVSHGFIQMAALYSKAWKHIDLVSSWYEEVFRLADADPVPTAASPFQQDFQFKPSPPLKEGALKQHDSVLDRDEHTNGGALHPEERPRHHRRIGTGATATSEDSDAGLEMKPKPLTVSVVHTNGGAKKARGGRGSRRVGRSKRTDARNGVHDGPNGVGGMTVNGAEGEQQIGKQGDGGDEAEEEEGEHLAQSPFARDHPMRRGSTWDLDLKRRRSAVGVGDLGDSNS